MTQQPRIKRASATQEDIAARSQHQSVRTTEDHDFQDERGDPQRLPSSTRRYHVPDTATVYDIPLTDGTTLRVTERKLATMPQEYRNAAQRVTSQEPMQRRQPTPKRPAPSDETVYEMPPARSRAVQIEAPRARTMMSVWLLRLGVGAVILLIIMLLGWLAINAIATWWHVHQDDVTYGRPRTVQTEANVGHGTSNTPESHFIAVNLNRQIIVIELPGDDPRKAKVYLGPTVIGADPDLTPVTLSFSDENGDGKVDMVIHVGESRFVFLNTGTEFQPAPNQ